MASAQTVYLVDGSGQFHRAFHAIRGLATSKGLPTNATYGFTTMLRKLLADEKPGHIAVVFDPPGKTFRHADYASYKANRPPMDKDLALQLPYIRRVCEALRMPLVEVPGFEADDVIATLVRQARERGIGVVVVSADKDLLQLVQDHVRVLNPGRDGSGSTSYDSKAVEEKWGVPPGRIVDVLALVGDSVDNIPGVAGIGDKGARDLVREFGSVEAVLENADKVKRAAYREGLKAHRAEALLSKQLVTLRRDVPVELDMAGLEFVGPDHAAAHALFKELEFQVLAREFAPELPNVTAEHRLAMTVADVEAAGERGARRGSARARRGRDERAGDARPPARDRARVGRRALGLRAARPLGDRSAARRFRARMRSRRCARCWRTRRSPRSRHTPSATRSCSGAWASRSRPSASTRCSRATCSTPAAAPTRSRTSRWSTSASGARREPTASRPRTPPPIPPRAPRAARPSSRCGSRSR